MGMNNGTVNGSGFFSLNVALDCALLKPCNAPCMLNIAHFAVNTGKNSVQSTC